jgi:hypothetical protein
VSHKNLSYAIENFASFLMDLFTGKVVIAFKKLRFFSNLVGEEGLGLRLLSWRYPI